MSILTEKPPISVKIGGEEVRINADYRVMLTIDALAQKDMPEGERGGKALALFYGMTRLSEEATERMLWFLRCGNPEEQETGRGGKASRPDFSFDHDAPLIFSAFYDQYGIDLVNVPFLHWWEFRALMDGLRADHRFCEVRRCRAIDLGAVKDKGQQKYYREMQKLYALPLADNVQTRQNAIADALMHGGDVSAVLGLEIRGGDGILSLQT